MFSNCLEDEGKLLAFAHKRSLSKRRSRVATRLEEGGIGAVGTAVVTFTIAVGRSTSVLACEMFSE